MKLGTKTEGCVRTRGGVPHSTAIAVGELGVVDPRAVNDELTELGDQTLAVGDNAFPCCRRDLWLR